MLGDLKYPFQPLGSQSFSLISNFYLRDTHNGLKVWTINHNGKKKIFLANCANVNCMNRARNLWPV